MSILTAFGLWDVLGRTHMKTPEQPKTQKTERFVPPFPMFAASDLPVIPIGVAGPSQMTTPTYHIDTPEAGGVLSWDVGNKYPVKGWPFREAVFAVDIVKRSIVNAIRFVSSFPIRYVAGLFILLPASWKRQAVNRGIREFTDWTDIVFDRWGRVLEFQDTQGNTFGLQGIEWKPNYFCDMVREVRRVAFQITGDPISVPDAVCTGCPDCDGANAALREASATRRAQRRLVDVISMLLEFDDAYRYRIQDLFGALNKEAFLLNPGRETARVLQLVMERGNGTKAKFGLFKALLPLLFRIGFIREVAVQFVATADLEKLKLDEADWYRCLQWGGYDFGGIPLEDRVSMRMMIDAEWNLRRNGLPKKPRKPRKGKGRTKRPTKTKPKSH